MPTWVVWAAIGVAVVSLVAFSMVWQSFNANKRDRAIQHFLDSADALERDLHECKRRMAEMREWVAGLPGEASKQASSFLNADASVQAALKRVLSERLWLRDSHQSATLKQLQDAEATMSKSRESLAENMTKLDALREELERANGQLDDAHRLAEKQRTIFVDGNNHTIH